MAVFPKQAPKSYNPARWDGRPLWKNTGLTLSLFPKTWRGFSLSVFMRLPFVLGTSLAIGFSAGLVYREAAHSGPLRASGGGQGAVSGDSAGARNAATTDSALPVIQGTSEGEGFDSLPAERQGETLARLEAKILKAGATGDMLLMARLVQGLDFERASALWNQFPKPDNSKSEVAGGARECLAERLAALAPERVLEMGKAAEDPRLAQAAVVALAQKSGADAIRALAQLPGKFQAAVASRLSSNLSEGLSNAKGSIEAMTAVLRENPKLLDPKSPSEGAVRRILGQVASQAAASDPTAAMADVRRLAAALVQVKPGEDPKPAESALVARIASQMTRAMRSDAPQSERAVFDSLADNEKNDLQVTMEAAARFRAGGAEEAIRFAEKQSKDQFTKDAAAGVWWSLAQKDRPAAMQWIESLPQGPFRDGALYSFMEETSFKTRSWSDPSETIRAGAEFLSRASKLDYFAMLAGQSRGPGVSRSEFIASLPLPEADKVELRRRLAPIRAK